ncbi:MAG: fibronectin type III-like domain-contianing protein, partial [Clostridia bacterium]|nr:fibronectin type III-like domain-contianing protein [Clostridia bacterium]
ICSQRLPSMSFDGVADSVLLVPPQGKYVADSLGKILAGEINPEGKLAYAGYDDMDTLFRQVQKRKKRGEQKIGQFIGYRYTDMIKSRAKYSFGHGLSYTSFEYAAIKANSKSVSFTVHNTGKMAGSEAIQIYVRCNTSGLQRPLKELKALHKTYLEPNQKKLITVDFEDLGIYDKESKKFVVEEGQYTVYVASSASDIRLSTTFQMFGQKLKASTQRISDYLHEVSNIRSESYIMEAHCKPMNKASKLKGISLWLFALTIFSDIIYGVCGLLFDIPFAEQIGVFLALNAAVLSVAIVLSIVYATSRAKAKKEQREKEKQATAELFKNAQKINASSVEKLFADEFDQLQNEQAKKTVTYKGEAESIYVYMAVDTDFQALCKDIENHFEANGMIISSSLAKNVVASLMSSRLLILRNKDTAISEKFIQILSSFFGTSALMESQEGRNWEKDSLLYSNTALGIKPRTLSQAIYNAQAEKQNVSFYAMTDVILDETASFLMPYVQFLGNPLETYTVTENGASYEIPSNLWFAIVPNKGESIDSLPAFIANLSSVIDLDVEKTSKASQAISYAAKSITPQQLEALKYRAKKAISIEEQVWKSVDTLEEFVNERTPYHIGNKIFLQTESYLSVYLSSGGSIAEAVDGMLSARLLPTILSLIKGNAQMAEVDFTQTIASIFGDEYIERSSKLIKYLVIDNSQKSSAGGGITSLQSEALEKTTEGDAKNAE